MLLADALGIPLSLIVTGANRHDVTQLAPALDALLIARPIFQPRCAQHLCADAGFAGVPARGQIWARHYRPHVRGRAEEKARRIKGHKPPRWVVEAAHSWFNRFRKLLVRYEKTHRSYVALTMLAAAIICFRDAPGRPNIIYG